MTQTTESLQDKANRLAEICDKRSRVYTEESAIKNSAHILYLALQEVFQIGFRSGTDDAIKAVNEQTTGYHYERG